MKISAKTALFIFVVLLAIFSGGCAHTWSPKEVPPIDTASVAPYKMPLSVDLINNQPDTTPQLFAASGGHSHYANYNEWTDFFIKTYTAELTRRGAAVSAESPNKMKVKLSNFQFFQGFAKVRANIKVTLNTDDGWTKAYEETDTSGWSLGRAFGSVIYHTIEKLLQDPEVINKMKMSAAASHEGAEGK
ncbi:MAG TPA: hypothetical protein VK448_09700 [Dissulfurispiraceae bacterium]|nr:hypothetical protein [Dissulfurispiraceae bacterium]